MTRETFLIFHIRAAFTGICRIFYLLGEPESVSGVGKGPTLAGTGGEGGAREDHATVLEEREDLIPEHIRCLH